MHEGCARRSPVQTRLQRGSEVETLPRTKAVLPDFSLNLPPSLTKKMFYRKAMVKAKKASRKDVHAEPTHAIKPKERKQKKQKGGSATQPQEGVGDLYLSSIFQMQLRRAKLKEKILNSGKTTGCSDGGAVDDGNTQGTLIIPKKRGSPPSWKSKVHHAKNTVCFMFFFLTFKRTEFDPQNNMQS